MGAERVLGLSLLELLVVLAILAVLAGAALLSAGLAQPMPPAERELQRLARGMRLACERARLSGLAQGLLLEKRGYAFAFDDGSGWLRYGAGAEAAFQPRLWPERLHPELSREGRSPPLPERAESPQIACFPSGELTPFELLLREPDGRVHGLKGTLLGRLERLHPMPR
ncbi:MAG: hypothetical protein KatS3mg125_1849 [Lysobacterales bacterium]|jgi:general secretion pathway protein H|nr:MAG: hypothetical protein KatS3mg125_1849 [Xanthomonadales bacterium]